LRAKAPSTELSSRHPAWRLPNPTHFNITRNYFPPAADAKKPEETSTDEAELAAKLPNAPATEPHEPRDVEEPSHKKQKTEAADDDFVVVDKKDAEGAPKADL
jgi:hypothetical protein